MESGGWCWARTVSKLDEWDHRHVWFHCPGGRLSYQRSWTTSDTAAATLFFEEVDHRSDAKKKRSFFSRPVIEKPHQGGRWQRARLRRSGWPLLLEGPCRTLARGADNVEQRRHDTSTREGRARSSQEDGKSDREGRDSVGSGCDGDEEDERAAGRFRKAGGCAGSSQAKERRRRQVKLEGAGQGVAVVPVRVAGPRRRPRARMASPQQRRRLHGARALCRG